MEQCSIFPIRLRNGLISIFGFCTGSIERFADEVCLILNENMKSIAPEKGNAFLFQEMQLLYDRNNKSPG